MIYTDQQLLESYKHALEEYASFNDKRAEWYTKIDRGSLARNVLTKRVK